MRPYLLFISGAAAMVGASYVEGPLSLRMVVACGVLFLSYGFGQALTDVFQTDTDALSSPYRPLVRGLVTKRAVAVVALVMLLGVGITLSVLDSAALLLALLGIAGIASYTWFKRRWWGGPFWNSWIVALLAVISRLAIERSSLMVLLGSGRFWAGIGAVFFSYANFVVVGYYKDLEADRQTGYDTFPVRFGWQANAVLSDFNLFAATTCTAIVIATGPGGWVPVALLVLAFAVGAAGQIKAHADTNPDHGWIPALYSCRASTAFPLAVVGANRPELALWLIVYYALFELSLRLRPEPKQV